jgi:hypothetical protein
VAPERSAGLLASAATAAMSAVMLDALLEEKATPTAATSGLEPGSAEQPIRIAA